MSETLRFALPLRIKATEESIQVVDRAGRVIFYVYVCAEPERRMNTKRLRTRKASRSPRSPRGR
ncbi:hypothetical protein ACFZ8E_07260 [Methylobacterium sp. HMF5984]|uniref:hypothetical protein n=1 Tax=Methylobacterium sp. HMF5984 TaxID=3367370 RepID=UPI003852B650